MEIYPDFRDMLASLNSRRVEFIVVGAYALAHHGIPRNTGDLDLFVRPTPDNASRLLEALQDFGFGSLGLKQEDFTEPGQVVQLGYPPVRIDLLTSITGVPWEQAHAGSVEGEYGGVAVRVIGRKDLAANKKATGRTKDLADLETLGEA
jgi:predicted nucleotidyltransferase